VYGAFVVFNHEESYRRCVSDYGVYRPWYMRWMQPPMLRMREHSLLVEPAMEPSTILWENLDTHVVTRLFLRTLTFLCTIFILAVSFIFLFYAQRFRQVRRVASCNGSTEVPTRVAAVPRVSSAERQERQP
jgi:hypothetical protein